MNDRTPEQVLTERMAAQRNGLASDGRGWFRTDEQRAEIAASVTDLLADLAVSGYSIVRTDELEHLQEIEAESSGRFRVKEIIKPDRDKDLYVGWSHVCEMPAWAGTRAQALAEGCPPSRLRRADERGTSMQDDFGCGWDDSGLIAEQRGYLPRARIGDYATLYLLGQTGAAFDLLEPFDGETEVRRD